MHFVTIKVEHRRDLIPAPEGVLNRGGELQGIAAHLGDAAPKILHGMVKDTLKHVCVFEDMVRLAETLLNIAPTKVEPPHQIARALVVNHGRLWFERLTRVKEHRQVVIDHLNALQGLLGEPRGLCRHGGHGLPFIAHLLQGDQRRRPRTLGPVRCRVQERIERPQVLAGDHRVHAWQPLSPLGVDGDETCMGVGRTQNGAVEGPQG